MSIEELAALDVQRVFRGHIRRAHLRFEQRRTQMQDGAAALITRVARGHVARSIHVGLLLQQLRSQSATQIQRIARGNAVRKHDRRRRALQEETEGKALHIQCVLRGHWSRVYVQRLRFMGAGGVVMNRYQLEPLNLTRAQREAKDARDKARAEGKEGQGEAEYAAATCLKTNRAVLIRYVHDIGALRKELALLSFLGADHVAPLFEVHRYKHFPHPSSDIYVMFSIIRCVRDNGLQQALLFEVHFFLLWLFCIIQYMRDVFFLASDM